MLESDIERKLVRGVTAIGGQAYKFVSPANRGVADRIVVLPGGRVWFVEVKTEVGKLTPLQEVFRQEVRQLGCNYVCLYGEKDVDNWLVYAEVVGTRCPNCASLQDQNTELDRKLADLEQTSLELCKACGWRTLIPAEGCLNCARSKLAELERKPLTDEEIKRIDDSTHFHESPDWSLRFARAVERAHGIGDSDE